MNAPPSLLVNDVRTKNHWIAFRLIGAYPPGSKTLNSQASPHPATPPSMQRASSSFTSSTSSTSFASSRDAIGARITLKAGSRLFVDEVRSGSSYDSNSDMRVHFGLGPSPHSIPSKSAGPAASPKNSTISPSTIFIRSRKAPALQQNPSLRNNILSFLQSL